MDRAARRRYSPAGGSEPTEQSARSARLEDVRVRCEEQTARMGRTRRPSGLARVRELEAELETGRRGVRERRNLDDVRVRLLLDTVLDATQGLRRELALAPTQLTPAEVVAAHAVAPGSENEAVTPRALAADNVTKLGFGGLTLPEQRSTVRWPRRSPGRVRARCPPPLCCACSDVADPTMWPIQRVGARG